MKLSATDCLRRGWTNLAANWELVVIQWLQSLVVVGLLALSLALPVITLGADALISGRSAGRVLDVVTARLDRLSPGVMMAGLAMLAVWLLSLLVHCWFQAGAYGVLAAADRQALPGSRRERLLFRTFTLRDFSGWGGLYLWRYFRLLVIFWILAFPLGMAVLFWLITLGVGGQLGGTGTALGIGCGGALPLGFLFLVSSLWIHVAQADLAREGSGVGAASRRGLSVLGRRLGTVFLLVLLIALAALAVAAVFVPVSFVPTFLLTGAPRLRTLVQVLLFLLQGLPNALLVMILAASLVALVRSEGLREIRRRPEVQSA